MPKGKRKNTHMTEKERELISEMLQLIDKIKAKADLIDTEERIPQLELELFVSKIEKLYEHGVVLKYLHRYADQLIAASIPKPVIAEVRIPEPKHEVVEPKLEAISKKVEETPKVSTPKSSSTVEDQFKKTPVKDLKAAIALNDRFQYTNELFGKNADSFNQALAFINGAENIQVAMDYIQNDVRSKYQWNDENPLVESFLDLVERRFLK